MTPDIRTLCSDANYIPAYWGLVAELPVLIAGFVVGWCTGRRRLFWDIARKIARMEDDHA